jgi:hypothetical protein
MQFLGVYTPCLAKIISHSFRFEAGLDILSKFSSCPASGPEVIDWPATERILEYLETF